MPAPGIGAEGQIGQYLHIAAPPPSPPADESPHALAARFAAAINDGDLDAALDLWLQDASLLQADGTSLRGREAIAPALQALIDNRIGFEVELTRVFLAGDVALGVGTLTMSGSNGHGDAFRHRSSSAVVYLRGPDGDWRIAIDAPWGLPDGATL